MIIGNGACQLHRCLSRVHVGRYIDFRGVLLQIRLPSGFTPYRITDLIPRLKVAVIELTF